MKIHFLGTRGWYTSSAGYTVCFVVETDGFYFVTDAGSGIHRLDEVVKDDKPIYIYISHMHLDHTVGLHSMGKFNFNQPVTVIVPHALMKDFNTLTNHPFSTPLTTLKHVNVTVTDKIKELPFKLEVFDVLHSVKCYGFRLHADGAVIGYTADSGICNNLYKIGNNADVFITECTYLSGEHKPDWPHLNPEDCALLAKHSNAKKLIMTHFEALRYSDPALKEQALKSTQATFPNAIAPEDGDVVEVETCVLQSQAG